MQITKTLRLPHHRTWRHHARVMVTHGTWASHSTDTDRPAGAKRTDTSSWAASATTLKNLAVWPDQIALDTASRSRHRRVSNNVWLADALARPLCKVWIGVICTTNHGTGRNLIGLAHHWLTLDHRLHTRWLLLTLLLRRSLIKVRVWITEQAILGSGLSLSHT